jgi:arginyl-tRNA synthetase
MLVALGDSLANVLASQGFRVHREFYYNDAGTQIENLALSVAARARGVSPDDPAFPADGYRGDYIAEIAKSYLAKETVCAADASPVQALGDPFQIEAVRAYSVAYLRREQDMDLAAFGVRFDRFSLESALYSSGAVESVVREVVRLGHAYEQDGALWLRSTNYGDDKDRVMRKSSGGFTYFVPDVAYHLEKYKRGYSKAINIQGSDHHGTIARVRAGLQALEQGIPKDFPDYILHKMVTVMRGGEEVKISKRAGAYVTLRDLIDWSGGRDAVRFFLVSRKADSEFVFDVDLAVSKSEENPVYYVQYAHARIAGVLVQAGYSNLSQAREWARSLQDSDLTERLDEIQHPKALALCARISLYPSILAEAAEQHSPHVVAFYLRELAADLHGVYNAERILVDAMVERESRLLLLLATAEVIASGLTLLGVSAPERM